MLHFLLSISRQIINCNALTDQEKYKKTNISDPSKKLGTKNPK